jgi:hypothetical protein
MEFRFQQGLKVSADNLLSNAISNRRDDGFIMHLPLIALRIRHGFGLKYARALEAFVRLFY